MPYRIISSGKIVACGFSVLVAMFEPVRMLALMGFLFVSADFVFGLIVSIRVRKEGIMSSKIYKTIWKLIGIEVSIVLAYLLDTHVLNNTTSFHLANVFAGIICGTELWSILTHFAILSDHPVFRLIKKWGKSEIEHKVGALRDFDKELNENKL
ncbi:MAG: phage holin family protein [Prevotellaceae bacterium]|jgi:phage-related holin|nr:phage holin family protein [Prevotellaceae bacterium]